MGYWNWLRRRISERISKIRRPEELFPPFAEFLIGGMFVPLSIILTIFGYLYGSLLLIPAFFLTTHAWYREWGE